MLLNKAWPIPSVNPGQVHSDPLAAQNLSNSTEHVGLRSGHLEYSAPSKVLCLLDCVDAGAGTFGNLGSEKFGY